MNALFPSLFALLGVAIGAIIQFLASRHVARESKYMEKRHEAYVDFMMAVGTTGEGLSEHDYRLMAARAKILAYGHDEVVKALSEFEKAGGYVNTEPQKKAFVNVIREIRKNIGGADLSDEEYFRIIMFSEWTDWPAINIPGERRDD